MAVMNPPIAISESAVHNADDLRGAIAAPFMSRGLNLGPRPRAGIIHGWGHEYAVVQTTVPGMRVNVRSGKIMIPAPQDGHGGWIVVNDGDFQVDLTPPHATAARTDLIIVRVADTQYTAGGDKAAAIRVITGQATSGAPVPSVPATEGAYAVLGQIAVASTAAGGGTITTANITLNTPSNRPYTVGVGGRLPVPNAAARIALPRYPGLQVIQLDTGQTWDVVGDSWVPQAVGRVGDVERAGYYPIPSMNNGVGQQLTSWHNRHGTYSIRGGYLVADGMGVHGDGTEVASTHTGVTIPAPPKYGAGEYADSGRGEPLGTWYWSATQGGSILLGSGPLLFNPATGRGDMYNPGGGLHATTWQFTHEIRVSLGYFVD